MIVEAYDSLAGWWTIEAAGSNLRLRSSLELREAAVSRDQRRLVASARAFGGNPIVSIPLEGDSLVTSRLATLAPRGYLPRWSDTGDSIAFSLGVPTLGVAILAASGGEARLALASVTDVDWHPVARKLVWAELSGGAGAPAVSRLLEYDMDSGRPDTLLRSSTLWLGHPRYSPDGTRLAYAARPIDGSAQSALWVGARSSLPGQQISSLPILDDYSWSPDGTRLALVRYDFRNYDVTNNAIVIVDVSSGATRVLLTGSSK